MHIHVNIFNSSLLKYSHPHPYLILCCAESLVWIFGQLFFKIVIFYDLSQFLRLYNWKSMFVDK